MKQIWQNLNNSLTIKFVGCIWEFMTLFYFSVCFKSYLIQNVLNSLIFLFLFQLFPMSIKFDGLKAWQIVFTFPVSFLCPILSFLTWVGYWRPKTNWRPCSNRHLSLRTQQGLAMMALKNIKAKLKVSQTNKQTNTTLLSTFRVSES